MSWNTTYLFILVIFKNLINASHDTIIVVKDVWECSKGALHVMEHDKPIYFNNIKK